jgi:hypothetical protein
MNDRKPNQAASPTRRSFLGRSMATAALVVPGTIAATTSHCLGASAKKLTGLSATLINEIMEDEMQHVPIVQNLLNDPDNPLPIPIRMPPNLNMKALLQPNLTAFLETASVFENTGSGLYGGALLNITQTQEYFPTAVGLATVEARHASWLNSLLGQSLVPDFAPVESSISQSLTLSRVAEFVTDPRSTFPSFNTNVHTEANGFFVLDFILFLEYIESAFYELNVPRFT